MYIVKLAVVAYFTIGDGWYSTAPNRPGLFAPLINMPNEMANLFLQAQNDNDYAGLCKYRYNGQNLLGEVSVPVRAGKDLQATPTASGAQVVKFSVWDLVDCRIANYLTFGSCNYTVGGLMAIWFITCSILMPGVGILFAVISFIYVMMLFLVVFKYAHIFILSMLTVAVLIFVSPLFLCFWLFQPTKAIFDSWFRAIIGYMVYPTLLFAFLALMLATFDSIYYGNIDITKKIGNQAAGKTDFFTACNGVNSIFCLSVRQFSSPGEDICESSWSNKVMNSYLKSINGAVMEQLDLGPLGKFWRMRSEAIYYYLTEVAKLSLFAFLFYSFMGNVASFLALLVGVSSLENYARGGMNLLTPASKLAALETKPTRFLGNGAVDLGIKGLRKLAGK